MAIATETTISLELVQCYTCGVIWGVPQQFDANRHDDKKPFYCPGGHIQSYTGRPVREQLSETERALQRLKQERNDAQADADRKGEQLASLRRRVKKAKSKGRKGSA